jgi:hypothetical protein
MLIVVLAVLCSPKIATAQISSSQNLGCTVTASGGIACNGIGAPDTERDKNQPKLSTVHYIVEPDAALDESTASSDYLIIGISGGDLVNEKPPFRHLFLEKDEVNLLPRGQPFHLRNKTSHDVEVRLIQIQR